MRNANQTFAANYTTRYFSNSYANTKDLLQGAEDTTRDFMLRLHSAIFADKHRLLLSKFNPIPELVPPNSSGEVFISFLQPDNVLFIRKPNDR